ncbi:sialate O-acetylesterase [Klebsiella aerogenes]|nr:sialate O-acetylesterase [Klebsiella aerogenes]
MKIRYAVAVTLASALFISVCEKTEAANAMPVYLLLGQSNMVGMRSVAADLPSNMQKPNKNALIYKDGKWIPVSPSSFEIKGFGPEVSFAHELAKKGKVGIIKVSAGDTKLALEWNSAPKGYLYEKTISEIKSAEKTKNIAIKGVMWMQGESDGITKEHAEAYKHNLEVFIKNIKKETGNNNLTFSVCRVTSPAPYFKYTPIVRKAQESIKMKGYKWFSCDDLTKGPDNLHYDTKGIVKLGELFSNSIK